MKGLIALDIDGTITANKDHLEKNVSLFLNRLVGEGWEILFLTGRTLSFSRLILSTLQGHSYLAVQNGAAIYQQPEEKIFHKSTISIGLISQIEAIVRQEGSEILLESGGSIKEEVFYKPMNYSLSDQKYLDYRKTFSSEEWIACEHFERLLLKEVAMVKVITDQRCAEAIAKRLELEMKESVTAVVLRDPFREQGYLVHINAKGASKKEALLLMKKAVGSSKKVIGAGDDLNDHEMLLASDIRVTMETAPEVLKSIAHIIAPSAAKEGIIEGIERAMVLL